MIATSLIRRLEQLTRNFDVFCRRRTRLKWANRRLKGVPSGILGPMTRFSLLGWYRNTADFSKAAIVIKLASWLSPRERPSTLITIFDEQMTIQLSIEANSCKHIWEYSHLQNPCEALSIKLSLVTSRFLGVHFLSDCRSINASVYGLTGKELGWEASSSSLRHRFAELSPKLEAFVYLFVVILATCSA